MKIKKKSNAIRVPPLKKAIKVKRKQLDTEEESTVSKAIQNIIKNVLKKKPAETVQVSQVEESHNITKAKIRQRTIEKKDPRGIVYLGHIPHGFYEEEMKDYFKQFGKVTRVRVVRSKNTGRSCGYGYVEFMYPEVAKIAAETMNNYLMCGRLLKAAYIPPEKQHHGFFVGKSWTKEIYPKLINRNKATGLRNANILEHNYKSFVQGTQDKLFNLQERMKEEGFNIEFIV